MAAQKTQKHCWQNFFSFFNASKLKTQIIKALNSHDSSRPYQRLLENPKPGGFRESFLSENIFKACYAVNFLKIDPDCGGLETNRRYEIQT